MFKAQYPKWTTNTFSYPRPRYLNEDKYEVEIAPGIKEHHFKRSLEAEVTNQLLKFTVLTHYHLEVVQADGVHKIYEEQTHVVDAYHYSIHEIATEIGKGMAYHMLGRDLIGIAKGEVTGDRAEYAIFTALHELAKPEGWLDEHFPYEKSPAASAL